MTNHGNDVDSNLFVMDNIFGFGLVRTHVVRFWVGPELRLFAGRMKDSHYSSSYGRTQFTSTLSGNMYSAAAGPAIGVNLNFGDTVTLCLSSSVLYSYARFKGTEDYTSSRTDYYSGYSSYSTYHYSNNLEEEIKGVVVDVHIGLLFRFGDDCE